MSRWKVSLPRPGIVMPLRRRDLPKNEHAAFFVKVRGGVALVRKVADGVFEAMHPDGVWRTIPGEDRKEK